LAKGRIAAACSPIFTLHILSFLPPSHGNEYIRQQTALWFLSLFKKDAVAALGKNTRGALARSMASVVARAYNGGLEAQPPVWSQGGKAPLKLMAF